MKPTKLLQCIETIKSTVTHHFVFSWCILVVAVLNNIASSGKRRSFGILIVAMHEEYPQFNLGELNWIGTSCTALGYFTMPFTTSLVVYCNRAYRSAMLFTAFAFFAGLLSSGYVASPHWLFLTHSFLFGLGESVLLSATTLVVGEYFDRSHRFHVLATTCLSPGPYGVLIIGPLFNHMVTSFSWRLTFQYITIPFVVLALAGTVLFLAKDFEYENLHQAYQPADVSVKPFNGWAFCSLGHLWEQKQIFLWIVDRILHNVILYALCMNLSTFVSDKLTGPGGVTFSLLFTLSFGDCTVLTVVVLIGDRMRGYLVGLQAAGALLACLMALLIYFFRTQLHILMALCYFMGIGIGVGNTGLYATSEEVMLVHGAVSYGLTKMMSSIGMLLAPPMSGFMIQRFGFAVFFAEIAGLCGVRALLMIAITIMVRSAHRKLKKTTEDVLSEIEVTATVKKEDNLLLLNN